MATTSKGVPYPLGTDESNGPAQIQQLAEWVDAAPGIAPVTTAQRDALSGQARWPGRIVYNLSTNVLNRWNGETWGVVTVTDHGALANLNADHHVHYLTGTRHDARDHDGLDIDAATLQGAPLGALAPADHQHDTAAVATVTYPITYTTVPGDTWTSVASLPAPARGSLAAASDSQGRIYAIAGSDSSGALQDVDRYDPATDTWTAVASLPSPARDLLAAESDSQGRIYAIGGQVGLTEINDVDRYDPATDTWSAVASLPSPDRGRLAAASDSQGRIYAIGGRDGNDPTTDVDRYDPATDTWTAVASLPSPARDNLAAASDSQGRIYAIGGAPPDDTESADVDRYDPATDTWTAVASLPSPARDLLAAASDSQGRIYAIGGSDVDNRLADVDRYDPATDTWTAVGSLPSPGRSSLAAASDSQGRIYAIGGFEGAGDRVSDVDRFDQTQTTVNPYLAAAGPLLHSSLDADIEVENRTRGIVGRTVGADVDDLLYPAGSTVDDGTATEITVTETS